MEEITDYHAQIVFECGQSDVDLFIDNVSLTFVEIDIPYNLDRNINIPDEFDLHNNYPNPFNPNTTIRYTVPYRSFVKIEVFNILGQRVKTLVNSLQDPGVHQVSFVSSNLSSGIYYYRMEARTLSGNIAYNQARKMVVLK